VVNRLNTIMVGKDIIGKRIRGKNPEKEPLLGVTSNYEVFDSGPVKGKEKKKSEGRWC